MDRDNPSILDSKIPKRSINQPSSMRFYPLKNLMFCWLKSLSNDELIINQSSSINYIHLYLHILLAKVPIKWRTSIFWWLEALWIHHDFPASEKVELCWTHATREPRFAQRLFNFKTSVTASWPPDPAQITETWMTCKNLDDLYNGTLDGWFP
jgi:hypothetical protein